jgi:hypothetical protein
VPPVIYKDHRGNRLPSVTTIIGRFKESGGLLYWANQQGLEGKTLDQARAEVTTPGTLAHKAVEDHINGRPETALTGAGEVTGKGPQRLCRLPPLGGRHGVGANGCRVSQGRFRVVGCGAFRLGFDGGLAVC